MAALRVFVAFFVLASAMVSFSSAMDDVKEMKVSTSRAFFSRDDGLSAESTVPPDTHQSEEDGINSLVTGDDDIELSVNDPNASTSGPESTRRSSPVETLADGGADEEKSAEASEALALLAPPSSITLPPLEKQPGKDTSQWLLIQLMRSSYNSFMTEHMSYCSNDDSTLNVGVAKNEEMDTHMEANPALIPTEFHGTSIIPTERGQKEMGKQVQSPISLPMSLQRNSGAAIPDLLATPTLPNVPVAISPQSRVTTDDSNPVTGSLDNNGDHIIDVIERSSSLPCLFRTPNLPSLITLPSILQGPHDVDVPNAESRAVEVSPEIGPTVEPSPTRAAGEMAMAYNTDGLPSHLRRSQHVPGPGSLEDTLPREAEDDLPNDIQLTVVPVEVGGCKLNIQSRNGRFGPKGSCGRQGKR